MSAWCYRRRRSPVGYLYRCDLQSKKLSIRTREPHSHLLQIVYIEYGLYRCTPRNSEYQRSAGTEFSCRPTGRPSHHPTGSPIWIRISPAMRFVVSCNPWRPAHRRGEGSQDPWSLERLCRHCLRFLTLTPCNVERKIVGRPGRGIVDGQPCTIEGLRSGWLALAPREMDRGETMAPLPRFFLALPSFLTGCLIKWVVCTLFLVRGPRWGEFWLFLLLLLLSIPSTTS